MFGTIAGGLLVGPWMGAWDIAWQEPTSGLVMLASLLIPLIAGLALIVEGSRRREAFAAERIQVRPADRSDASANARGRKGNVA